MYVSAIGKHPDRLRNLYFLYAVVLRAVNRAAPILQAYDYDTHLNHTEDVITPELVEKLLNITLTSCE